MKMSWCKDQTSGKVIVQLEIDEAEFAALRIFNLSEYDKLSNKLKVFARLAAEQEAVEEMPFEEHVKQLRDAMTQFHTGLQTIDEVRERYALPVPVPDPSLPMLRFNNGKNSSTESTDKERV